MSVAPIPNDDARLRAVVDRLRVQQRTQGAGPIEITPAEGGAVLNALTGVEIGKRFPVERICTDAWETGPKR